MSAEAIAAALGLKRIRAAHMGVCPACGYRDTFSVREEEGRTLCWCASCRDQEGILDALRDRGLWGGRDFQTSARPSANPANSANAAGGTVDIGAIWRRTDPATGTAAETYLRSRGITLAVPPALRFMSACRHTPTGTIHPAMIAGITRWPANATVAIHRTYLREDGTGKAPVDLSKTTLGLVTGGAVRLAQPGPELVLAEGIETALSVMQATDLPAWACVSAGNMVRVALPPLPMARSVFIAADHDASGTGQRAAHALADRLVAEGRTVKIVLPLAAGLDFNDMLTQGGAQ